MNERSVTCIVIAAEHGCREGLHSDEVTRVIMESHLRSMRAEVPQPIEGTSTEDVDVIQDTYSS